MSDVVWYGVVAILFVAGFACAAYSGWQVFCPMHLRRIHVIYLTSQKLRVKGEHLFWKASFAASVFQCAGIILALVAASNQSHRTATATATASVIVVAVGGTVAAIGFAVDRYYAYMANIVRNEEIAEATSDHYRELESAAVR